MKAYLIIAILALSGCANEKRPFDSNALIIKGDELLREGDYEGALLAYNRASQSGRADAFVKRGVVLIHLGRYDEALEAFDTAVENNGGFDAWNNRGSALYMLGRYNESLAAFETAISIDPSYPEVYGSKADALRKLGRQDDALNAYREAVNKSDDLVMSYHNLGSLLASMERYEEALDAFNKSLRIAPHTETLANKADVLKILGRDKEADEELKSSEGAHSLYGSLHVHTVNKSLPGFG